MHEREGQASAALQAYRQVNKGDARKTDASTAAERLERQGVSAPAQAEAAGLASRQSSLRIAGSPSLQRGEVVVSIDATGIVGEAMALSGDVPAPLLAGLKGMQVPGSDVAKARQVRLFRAGSSECTAVGQCTIVWHRVP